MVENKDSIDYDKKLRDLQGTILYRKIFLTFLIREKSKYDRYYHLAQMIIAVATPIMLGIAQIYNNYIISDPTVQISGSTSVVGIIMSAIVAAMVELKNRLKLYEKISIAKDQNIKYKDLYEKIGNYLLNGGNDYTFYSLCSEKFYILCSYDPESDFDLDNSFKLYCQKEGIKYVDDIAKLKANFDVELFVSKEENKENERNEGKSKQNYNVDEDILWTRNRINSAT